MDISLLNEILNRGQNDIDVNQFKRELTNKFEEMENRYTVDRFEGDIAVIENRDTGEMININKNDLPNDIHEGSILKINNGKYEIDLEEEKNIEQRIKDKMNKLWK